ASSLAGVVAQRLVRVLCPRCRKPYVMSRDALLDLIPDFPMEEGESEVTLYHPYGCLSCNNTGFRGRCGIYEFLRVTEEIQSLILTHASNHEIKTKAVEQGMTTLRGDGLLKVREGITSLEEMLRVII
ncbi:MAG: type II secretion system protein GspE, partial [Oscillospiraceae bacterium]